MDKIATRILDNMYMEKQAAGWGKALLDAGKSIMNSGTMKNLSGTVKNFAKSPLGKSTLDGLKQGAMIGGISGALNPGVNKNGNQQNRLTSAIKGTIGGGVTGAGIGAASFGVPKAYNTVKNAWPTKTASETLDDMYMEKQAANIGMITGGVFSGIGKATKVFGKPKYRNLSTLAKLGKVGRSVAVGATVGGVVEGVADHLSNKSQGMQQQDYPGKQNLNG